MSTTIFLFFFIGTTIFAQESIARRWNEEVLEAIRNDFARPTVHARNLYHTSLAMYDAWAVFEPNADTYLIGKTVKDYTAFFNAPALPEEIAAAREEVLSYAMYRLIIFRFRDAPGRLFIEGSIDRLMAELGYDPKITSRQYHCGNAQLGNYIAEQVIAFGAEDFSNELEDYINTFYEPVNPPLEINRSGNPDLIDLNRWQPLEFPQFIDQAGNLTGINVPEFVGAEWGRVTPFALAEEDLKIFERDNNEFYVYHDPGPPVYIESAGATGLDDIYKWNFSLVSVWSSHLSAADTTLWDISPGASGNIQFYPTEVEDYPAFYNFFEGGDPGQGRALNPVTGQPYTPNLVRRGDYTRVLAEFWADGPDSETPPGHWFTILNEINDHPELEKKFMGTGEVLTDLEWDVKSYLTLGGAMHDVAISVWGVKGWYDYIRPVSALRGMAELGQSSDSTLSSFNPQGLPLIEGYIELVQEGDILEGAFFENVGKVKVNAWRGPGFVPNPNTDQAGVGWVLAENWWPYQRPTFVTPPFAGYVSGHSTFSRAAAEVLTAFTGSEFFPGGIGVFSAPKDDFLVFEEGPSEAINLQWATYRDAADQCSLSRIWGGIHPPIDDLRGREMGSDIGQGAFALARTIFESTSDPVLVTSDMVYPNPAECGVFIPYEFAGTLPVQVFQMDGRLVTETTLDFSDEAPFLAIQRNGIALLTVVVKDNDGKVLLSEQVLMR